VIIIDSNVKKYITPKEVAATLDIEEDEDDGRDEYDVDEDDDGNITDNINDEKQSKSGGVMQQILKAVQDRLKWEKGPKCKGLNEAWLLKFLDEHDWSIPQNQTPKLVRKLRLKHDTALFKYYYTRLDVWMPDLRWGHMHMPCCPDCKHNYAVGVHGYPVHPGRMVVGQQDNYYIITRRYICSDCEEQMQFSTYVHEQQSSVSTIDDKKAATDWNRSYVDGINIWPKPPCHIRTYLRKWEKGQRCKEVFNSSRSGREKLAELNLIEPAATANQSIPIPPQMPQPEPAALHNQPYTIVANSMIGEIPLSSTRKRKRGQRGKDAKPRQPRRCRTCVQNGGANFATCKGRWARSSTCEYFSA
jgi:hypothetical protein